MAGVSQNDRVLAAEVRRMSLKKIKKLFEKEEQNILDSNEQRLYESVLLKLASTVLPRINEHTGEDGEAMKVQITGINYIIPNGNNTETRPETTPGV